MRSLNKDGAHLQEDGCNQTWLRTTRAGVLQCHQSVLTKRKTVHAVPLGLSMTNAFASADGNEVTTVPIKTDGKSNHLEIERHSSLQEGRQPVALKLRRKAIHYSTRIV